MEYENGAAFWEYFERIRSRTSRVIGRIPPQQIDWRPAPGMFSFADLIRHLAATERYMFGENARRRPSRYPGHGTDLADGYDAVLGFLTRMHEETARIVQRLTAEELRLLCETPGGSQITVWKWLRSMVEHEVHHRGQIYLMLRLLGVTTPPLYGLTSEEVRARSIP